MKNGFVILNEETDLELAEKSAASNLKLLESMLRSDPENQDILQLLTSGYASYAIGFVEDETPERARNFYIRSKEYGIKLLKLKRSFNERLAYKDFENSLLTFKKEDIPALFWTGIAWGSYISLSLTQPDALADLPKVEAMMRRIIELDDTYFYGGAYFYLGALYGSRPKLFGGNPEESKRNFERCIYMNNGKFLLAYVYYAKTYAVQIQDPELFQELLLKVENSPVDILPEANLINAIAKKKAERLKEQFSDLF